MKMYDSLEDYKDEWTECSHEYWRKHYEHSERDNVGIVGETSNNIILTTRCSEEGRLPHHREVRPHHQLALRLSQRPP